MRATLLLAVGTLLGCGTDSRPQYVANFDPPDPPPGFTRFLTPTMKDIAPGDNLEYCQWVAGPADVAQDVLEFTGLQSPTGHHAVLYATSATQFPVGETHLCTEEDTLPISFVGALGGEGTSSSAAKLPDGLYFRLQAGQALMINTHWLNATDEPVDGQAVIDVKLAPASDQRQTADLFANTGVKFKLVSGTNSFDTSCVLEQDMNFAMVGNHMHTHGTSAYSELIRLDGTKAMLAEDTTWAYDQQFNPKYTMFSLATPMVAHAGDTVHTHCEWQNTENKALTFPDEMCVGIGFYFPSHGQIGCVEGVWPTK
jgi:hypothetical protein